MAMTLTLESLKVETFTTSSDERVPSVGLMDDVMAEDSRTDTCNVTLYGCSCGCETAAGCGSGPRCTDACIEPSNLTDYIACCG